MIPRSTILRRLVFPSLLLVVSVAGGAALLSSSAAPTAAAVSIQEKGTQSKDKPEPREKEEGREQHDEDTKLAGIMQKMRGDMKRLRPQLESKDQAAAWKTVCSIQQHILEIKQESPEMAQGKSEAERPAFVNAFRAKISELLKTTCDLEAAVLASQFDEAEKVLRNMIGPMQKAGHKQFRND
jgi:hypothetical protein